jgi:hypothetical protein
MELTEYGTEHRSPIAIATIALVGDVDGSARQRV